MRVYQFIKRLYSQIESLRVINSVPSTPAQPSLQPAAVVKPRAAAQASAARGRGAMPIGSEGGTGGIR